jgi:hypothetical protein
MVKRRCSRRRCGPRLSARSARNRRHKRSARGKPPWLYVAFEAADDLSLALALRGAPCDVFLRATISAHPSQADHVQRAVGLSVATAVETVPDDLAGRGFDGSDPAEAGEGSLAPQPLWVVPGHNQERRCVVGTDARQRDQLRGDLQLLLVESPRKRWRSCSGAVTRKPWSWLAACVLALIAERRAARRALIISTRPSPLFGTPDASPASTARAAHSASEGSDFSRRCSASFAAGASGAPHPAPRPPWPSGGG